MPDSGLFTIMGLIRKPFENYTLEEEKKDEKSEVISIRLNTEERAMIEETKALFNIQHDAKAIKLLMKWSYFVIHGKSIADIFKYLFKKERAKRIDSDSFDM